MTIIGYYPMNGSTIASVGTNMTDAGTIGSVSWVIGRAVKFLNAWSGASTVSYTVPILTAGTSYVKTYCIMSFLISLAPQSWDFTNFNLAWYTLSGLNYSIQNGLQTNSTGALVTYTHDYIQSTHDVWKFHNVILECIITTHWGWALYFSTGILNMYFDWVLTQVLSGPSWDSVSSMTMSISLGDTTNQDQIIDEVIICTDPKDLWTSYLERSLYYKWIL